MLYAPIALRLIVDKNKSKSRKKFFNLQDSPHIVLSLSLISFMVSEIDYSLRNEMYKKLTNKTNI